MSLEQQVVEIIERVRLASINGFPRWYFMSDYSPVALIDAFKIMADCGIYYTLITNQE